MIPHVNGASNDKEAEDIDLSNLYQYEKQRHLNWYDQVLLNRPLRVIIVGLGAAVLAPLLIYHFLFSQSLQLGPSDGSCLAPRPDRLPCGLGNIPQSECHPQCCYDLHNNMCFHYYPSRFSYIMDRVWTEEVILQPRIATVPFSNQNSIPRIRISIDEVSESHMSLQFYDASETSLTGRRIEGKRYSNHVTSPEMSVSVEANQGLIFSTIRGPLIASTDIWEIAFRLTDETMYGLGEIPLNGGTSKVIYSHRGGISSIPLIFAKGNDTYHGVLIDAMAPTEVLVLEANQIVVRSLTSSGLKLHVFAGPKPSDVMEDAMKLIGVNNQLEYWMLGAHICSESSKSSEEALKDLEDFISTAASDGLPFESHCGPKPIVFDSGCDLEENKLHEDGAARVKAARKRYIPQVSPYIRHEIENETSSEEIETLETYRTISETCVDVVSTYEQYMLRTNQSQIYVGSVGDDTFVYPMFENSSAEFMKSLWAFEADIDGIILENNWPLDEYTCNETSYNFPYFSENFKQAFEMTPKYDAIRPDDSQYFNKHNEYGNQFVQAIKTLFDVEIPTWTTSQYMNGEVRINRQSIDTSWANLRRELTEAALGGASGHWSWLTPICGDTASFDPELHTNLCVKWYMAATYMPLIKIHSSSTARHPSAFTGTNKNLMVTALNKRLSLLPYFFTTLQTGPLLRPMFYQFPASEYLKDLSSQYSVGECLVIVPNLQPSQSHVHFYVPPGKWYELWGGLRIEGDEGDVVTLTTTEADFLTFIRGGSVLIMQKDVKTTAEETRLQSEFTVTIALDCDSANTTDLSGDNPGCVALGNLYLTKENSLAFRANETHLIINATGNDFETMCGEDNAIWAHVIKDISIYGLDNEQNNYDNHRQVPAAIDLCDLGESVGQELIFHFQE